MLKLALVIVSLLVIIYIIAVEFLGSKETVPGATTQMTVSDAGITSIPIAPVSEGFTMTEIIPGPARALIAKAKIPIISEGFSTLFPYTGSATNASGRPNKRNAVGGGYPVYTMMQLTQTNIDAVNALDSKAWDLITGVVDNCAALGGNSANGAALNACKTYGIKNKGQFRVHLDNFRRWLEALNTGALGKLGAYLTSAGIEYDFDKKMLFITKASTQPSGSGNSTVNVSTKYIILPITSKDTPIVDSVSVTLPPPVTNATLAAGANATATANSSSVVYPASYTLYTTYTMIVMAMHKAAGKDVQVDFDLTWSPISSQDYLQLLSTSHVDNFRKLMYGV